MSIKTNKMVLAAGVSALALMMFSSHVMAQETTVDVGLEQPDLVIDPVVTEPTPTELDPQPIECGFEYEITIEPTPEPELVIEPEITDPVLTLEPEPELVIEPEIIEIVPHELEEPIWIDDGADGNGNMDNGDALLDIVPLDAGDIADESSVEPTVQPMLDDGTVVAVDAVERTADEVLQTSGTPLAVALGESAQDRVANAAEVPNLCDTAAGQKNKFFCGSYHKK